MDFYDTISSWKKICVSLLLGRDHKSKLLKLILALNSKNTWNRYVLKHVIIFIINYAIDIHRLNIFFKYQKKIPREFPYLGFQKLSIDYIHSSITFIKCLDSLHLILISKCKIKFPFASHLVLFLSSLHIVLIYSAL